MEKLAPQTERTTKGMNASFLNLGYLDGLKISNSQVKRLERELKNLKEEVRSRSDPRLDLTLSKRESDNEILQRDIGNMSKCHYWSVPSEEKPRIG